MKLIHLKLSGFKSFIDPTIIKLPHQLVGVVGPNGCGKSNIIDAVRWVLGELKASELRGDSMQDVIFNGTSSRKPAGRASVELLFDNSLGKISGEWNTYGEISVKRTLLRDGSSTYFINNQVVRRRDIQDIFLGTGLGPRAYAIIGQGMISKIIEAKPDELRIFIEEAAGVSKYKERRKETENRLSYTKENLQRVEDILIELNVNIEKLQSQSKVAEEYNFLNLELQEKQQLVWLIQKNDAELEQKKYNLENQDKKIKFERLNSDLIKFESELESLRQLSIKFNENMQVSQAKLYEINAEIGKTETEIKYINDSKLKLKNQNLIYIEEKSALQDEISCLEKVFFKTEEKVIECFDIFNNYKEKLKSKKLEMPFFEEKMKSSLTKKNEFYSQISRVEQNIELELTKQNNSKLILADLIARKEKLKLEELSLYSPEQSSILKFEDEITSKEEKQKKNNAELINQRKQIQFLEKEIKLLDEKINLDKNKTSQLKAKLQILTDMQAKTESKIMPWLEKNKVTDFSFLFKRIKVDSGWEKAFESILREKISSIEIDDFNSLISLSHDLPLSKITFYVTKEINSLIKFTKSKNSSNSNKIISKEEIKDQKVEYLLNDWLDNYFISESLILAIKERNNLPSSSYFVTQEGHIISKFAVQFYSADTEQDGMLLRKKDIDKFAHDLFDIEDNLKLNVNKIDALDKNLNECIYKEENNIKENSKLTTLLHQLQMNLLKSHEAKERFLLRKNQINMDLNEINIKIMDEENIKTISQKNYEKYVSNLNELKNETNKYENSFFYQERLLNEEREVLRKIELDKQEADFTHKTNITKAQEIKTKIFEKNELINILASNIDNINIELKKLSDQESKNKLSNFLGNKSEYEVSIRNMRTEYDILNQNVILKDEERLKVYRSIEPIRNRITELKLKEQEARINKEHFENLLKESKYDEKVLLKKITADIQLSVLSKELLKITSKIESLGPVNLAAMDELSKCFERKKYLDLQNEDLIDAIETLEKAISKIDLETRQLLQSTFDNVNNHFGRLFPELFGGGSAKLIISGNEILDSGFQVMAQPPGKKNTSISLLSGGEKALAATALVFSIFQLNPAPFCLLDEVDAPLDDANTDRFCSLVKRLSKNTQFMFISHNKITMEIAQQLVGVTMQEQGVSRVVAVNMSNIPKLLKEPKAA